MGVPNDDLVIIEQGKKPTVITVNCPDKTGLGCDLSRIILEFGLSISKGDVSTDGRWCYIVLWVDSNNPSITNVVRWENLKERLVSVCPSCLSPFIYFNPQPNPPKPSPVYLLEFCCVDRKGLLHDVTQILSELELLIQRVKVMTTPDDKVVDLFFITDCMELLHTKERQDETCKQLKYVLGESCISCELKSLGPEYEPLQQGVATLSPQVSDDLFSCQLSDMETRSQALSADLTKLKKTTILVDDYLSPSHTLLQIHCVHQKGLLYDIMRMSKDCDIKIAHGRFSSNIKGYRNIDLLIQQNDGKKISDPEKQSILCARLKMEMLHPLRVAISNRGPDTELWVANPVEASGKGRPRVFYDVTLALKVLGICIFSARIWRHSTSDREWEVYRFLLDENPKFPFTSSRAREQIVDRVRRTLMGW
ncbi:ACT domain-containing protein acr9 [Ranunculus cassubicifolius]